MSDLEQIQNPAPEPLPELSFRQQMQERFDFAWTYIFVVLLALIVIFTIWHGTKFFDRTNFRNIALDSSQLMLLAVGQGVANDGHVIAFSKDERLLGVQDSAAKRR